MISSEPQNILLPNLVWWCCRMSQCHAKQTFFAVLKVKVTARAYIIKILHWLRYLLNCWFFGNQTWSDDRLSQARASCGKSGLLPSRSRSQRRVKMSMFIQMIFSKPPNILPPNSVLWCIIMNWSIMQKTCLQFSRSRSQQGLISSKYYSDYYIFWTADSLATKLGPMIGNHRPERLVEKRGLLPSRSRT